MHTERNGPDYRASDGSRWAHALPASTANPLAGLNMQITCEETTNTSRKWVLVLLLSAGLAMDYLVRLAPNSIFPILRVKLGVSDFELGLLVSVFLWTYGILSPAAGFIGDRFSRRTVVIAAVAAWSVVTMLSAVVTRPWHFIVMRGVLGAAEVCFMPTAQALIADYHDDTTRSKAIGLFEVGAYCGIFLAGLPVAYSASRLGWRIMLLLCGVMGLMLAYIMHMSLPRTANSERAADLWAPKYG